MFNTLRPFVSLALRFYLQNHCAKSGTLGLGRTNSGSVNEPLMGGSFFCGERGGDRSIGEANLRKGAALQWLAHLAPVRGVSPFYGSGTAARPRSLSKMDSLAWLRWAGAGRACRRGGKPLAIGKANAPTPRSFRIWSFVYIRIKCQRILSFPKALFYSLAALRIK